MSVDASSRSLRGLTLVPAAAIVLVLVLEAIMAFASPPAVRAGTGVGTCDRLLDVDLPDATVIDAQWHAAGPFDLPSGDAVEVAAPFCRVSFIAQPTPASEIGIEVWLPEPSDWNDSLWGWGNSGFGGAFAYASLGDAVGGGYATVATDGGHQGRGTDWALGQPEKVVDLGHRAVHLAAVYAKAIAAAYYGEPPRHAYFSGFSTGGTQGLMLAQRYPDDYDGIVAGGADQDWTGLYLWLAQLQFDEPIDPDRHVSSAQIAALADAALAVCGDASGLIPSPDRCDIDAVLRAYAPTEAVPPLTTAQLDYLRRLYAGPLDPTGHALPMGYAPGSEAQWGGIHFGDSAGHGSWVGDYLAAFFRNVAFEDSTWDPATFRFDRDTEIIDGKLADALNATDPDLRRYAAGGGKLILWHGWSDPLVPPGMTLRYYERVRHALGADTTSVAVRLFMVPGVGHTSGDPHRSLSAALRRWVETGTAPEQIVGPRRGGMGASTAQTDTARLLCAWPRVARYRDPGPPDDAARFECARAD